MRLTLNPSSVADYATFLRVKSLPHYEMRGTTMIVPDEYASELGIGTVKPDPVSYKPTRGLFDYQEAIACMAITRRKFSVFADCGLGKTLIMAEFAKHAAASLPKDRAVLIVSPLMVVEQTVEEIGKWYGKKMPVEVLRPSSLSEWLRGGKSRVGIVNYDAMDDDVEPGRLAALILERSDLLRPYVENTAVFDLSGMSQEAFATLLEGQKLAHQSRLERERAEAKARAEREAAEQAERKRLAEENDRLRAEQAEKDRIARLERELADAERREAEQKAAAERAAHEAVLRKEREAREQLERDAAAQRAEAQRKAREEEAARVRAEQAPDAEKLEALAAALLAVQMPECSSRNARLAVGLIHADIEKLAEKCRQHANRLKA